MIYSKYLVKDSDRFDPREYPALTEDLKVIVDSMAQSPASQRSQVLLSFVKDHCIETEWVRANPALAERISSKSLPVANLEALFASSGENLTFRRELEEYVICQFK